MRPSVFMASALWLSLGHPLAASGQQQAAQSMDVVLVLDNSGSMRKNDPNSLMRGAVSEFASRLSSATRLGIVVFDQDVELTMGLTAPGDSDFKARLEKSLKTIDYTGRWTDIPAGVERALYELRVGARPDAAGVVVFFTDGIVDVGDAAKNLERAQWLRNDLVQSAKRLGIRIFGVAFTDAADFQLIQSVAQSSDGEYFRVLAAEDIPGVFRRITERIQRPVVAASRAVPSPVPVAPAEPASSPWLWVGGAVASVLAAAVALVARRRRSGTAKPSVAAGLKDLGGHTGLETHPLDKAVTRIGRVDTNDVVIPNETVSSEHALIEFRDGSFYLRDLRSANGTFVNGKRFSDPESIREMVLKHRDRIRFDAYEFEFVADALASVAQTQLVQEGAARETILRPQVSPDIGLPPAAEPTPETLKPPVQKQDEDALTRLKPDMCPNHPWKATEVCPDCRRAVCRHCLIEIGGRRLCTDCAKAPAV